MSFESMYNDITNQRKNKQIKTSTSFKLHIYELHNKVLLKFNRLFCKTLRKRIMLSKFN